MLSMKRLFLIIAALAWLPPAHAQSVLLSPWPNVHFEDNNGNLCTGCKLFTYAAGTTTKQNTYTSSTGGTANVNPVILNSRGEANVWLTPGLSYKYVLSPSTDTDPPTNAFWTVDNILTSGLFGTMTTTPFSSLNARYFPTFSQLAAYGLKLTMSAAVSDASGTFRDSLYVENTDTDTTTYTAFIHSNHAGRFATFGAYTSAWQTMFKNEFGISSYAIAATSGTAIGGVVPTVSGISAAATQMGAGIGSNNFYAGNPTAGGGALAQAKALYAVQGTLDANYANVLDGTTSAYVFLASNTSTKTTTAFYGASGSGVAEAFLDSGGVIASAQGIIMPASASGHVGTIIDYGKHNGQAALAAYSQWAPASYNGQFGWVSNSIFLGALDINGFVVGPGTGAAIATTATAPFIYLTSMAGTPTGVPVRAAAGLSSCVIDTTAVKIWCYVGGAWKFAALS